MSETRRASEKHKQREKNAGSFPGRPPLTRPLRTLAADEVVGRWAPSICYIWHALMGWKRGARPMDGPLRAVRGSFEPD